MTSEETRFRQTAIAKYLAGNHTTYYEKVAVGRYYAPQLSKTDMDIIQVASNETYEAERMKIEKTRNVGLESFTNDFRMDMPVALTLDMHLFHNVFKFVEKQNMK